MCASVMWTLYHPSCRLTTTRTAPHTAQGHIIDPEAEPFKFQVEATIEGENVMRMSKLPVDDPPAMAPSFNITCRITPDSPLWGKTYEDLESEGTAIQVALSATDNQHFQQVYMRKFYRVAVRVPPCCSHALPAIRVPAQAS